MERLLNGRYRLGPKIGDGGMAIVYRGFDTALERGVAIKVLREQYAADRTFVARFEREAQAVAALVHPNIINIFDVGFDWDEQSRTGVGHYFVMELIDGPNLKELIRARKSLPVDEIVAILTQVLSGLGYAHARALVHRDIKPQNIMLTPEGTAKVTDFGIAKGLADVTLTEAGFGMGTVHYISPEQARGEPATPASDLYAVGVMLYELLTGVLPFTGDSTVGIALKHVQEPPLSPKRLNSAIPTPLAAITMRALAKEPGARFADAREMAAALADWQHWRDRRVAPPPDTRSRRSAAIARGTAVAAPVVPIEQQRTAGRGRGNSRGGVGCLTWLTGTAVLLALVALIAVGYRLSPFGASAADPTPVAIAGLPTEAPEQPTATPEPPQAIPTAPFAGVSPTLPATARPAIGTPLPSARPAPTATVTAPTATVGPATPTAKPTPSATATAALVSVPDLSGKTLTEAKAVAEEVGFLVEQVGAQYSDRPVGQVVTQQPGVGKQLARGGTITVILSRGPQAVTVPDVKGQGYAQAVGQLEAAGLVAVRRDVASRNVPKGVVIDQDPLAGNTARPGATVTLTVSLGDVAVVPELFGVPFDTARQRLIDAGFGVNVNGQTKAQIERENPTFFSVYPNVQDGQVISQSLPAGSTQPRGATISIAYYKAK
ncbi:MAG TPA: PASTA domain-containing protein [Thermomicrobiales bacterium]|jgi:serine/threonine-protein kinase